MKKGMELSMNTIIIAVILLVVAAVLIAIFTGGIKGVTPWFKSVSSCEGQGNDCVPDSASCAGQAVKSGCDKNAKGEFCCLRGPNAR